MFTATPGRLPATGQPVIHGVQLPAGRRIAPFDASDSPVAWISQERLPATELEPVVAALVAAFPFTGLWPLIADGLGDLDRPWFDGEFAGPDHRALTAREILDGSFRRSLYGDDLVLDEDAFESPLQFTEFADPVDGPNLQPHDIGLDEDGALLLVPVDRPANVPKVLGWLGPTNYDLVGEPLSAVLRSWEERFGAVPIAITFDSLTLLVPRAPRRKRFSRKGDTQLRLLAAEHYALCPDNIDQGMDPNDYVAGLAHWGAWEFWWD